MTDHDYYPQGYSLLDDYFLPREIVQFKQHTLHAFMVRIFRVLTYMHLHAREIRLFVYQTIKWHLLKQVDLPRSLKFNLVDQCFKLVRIVVKTCLLLIFFLNITIKNFYLCLFNSHIFSDFLDCLWYNKTPIYWLFGQNNKQQVYCPHSQ